MSWNAEFDEPITLPGGGVLRTLRDAGNYVLKLPKTERDHERWQNAAEALTLVAEQNGPTMFARMAMTHALAKDRTAAPLSERKDRPWGRRPLRRDT